MKLFLCSSWFMPNVAESFVDHTTRNAVHQDKYKKYVFIQYRYKKYAMKQYKYKKYAMKQYHYKSLV